MDRPKILLVNLQQYASRPTLQPLLEVSCCVRNVDWREPIDTIAREFDPCALFFEFDFPDLARLLVLEDARQALRGIPSVMFTEAHSEALAVWALRVRVWNYFVKPVDSATVQQTVGQLYRLALGREDERERYAVLPAAPVPEDARFRPPAAPRREFAEALRYVEENLSAPISQKEAARRCGVSASRFSRLFKQSHGKTFQSYVMERRLEAARQMLRNRSASVSDVCWNVGFRDVSYFGRLFRRRYGASPSRFRHEWISAHQSNG